MSMGTSDYWRKVLRIDEKVPADFFSQNKSSLCIFKPFFIWILGKLLNAYYQVEVIGRENLSLAAPYILASNHQSNLDVPLLMLVFSEEERSNIYIIAKKYLFHNPLVALIVRGTVNCFPVDAEHDFLPALQAAAKVLSAGKILYIAPEGTRSKTGEVGEFRVGVGVLAVEAAVPIVPVYIHGTIQAWPKKSLLPRRGKVKIVFGKPFDVPNYVKEISSDQAYDTYKKVTEELREKIIKLKPRVN